MRILSGEVRGGSLYCWGRFPILSGEVPILSGRFPILSGEIPYSVSGLVFHFFPEEDEIII